MDALQSELRWALRSLRKSPAFTLVAVLTLTLGITANTAVFSLVDAILLRPLPYPDADRIVMRVNTWSKNSSPLESSTRFEVLRRRPSFDAAAAYRVVGVNLSARGEGVHVLSLQVTDDFFRLFGASIAPGRAFHSDDFHEGAADVVVLTRGLWQLAIRAALGASRARIALQLFTECVVLAVPSGIIAAVAGMVSIGQVLRILPATLPRLGEHGSRLSVDWPAFFVSTALLCTVTAIVVGLVPAVHASKSHVYDVRTLSNRSAGRARSLLIVTETALAVVLLVGATLFIRTFVALRNVSPGFDGHRVLTVPMSLTGPRFVRTDAIR
jgi:hypothetical protein